MHAVLLQIAHVGIPVQEPQQLVDDGPQVQLLGGQQRKTRRQVEAHLVAEDRERARARPVLPGRAVVEDVLQ